MLTRGSRRAALNQWWTPRIPLAMQTISLGVAEPLSCAADGTDIWVIDSLLGSVYVVQASTGAILGTWFGATNGIGALAAAGKVFVAGNNSPGTLYVIDPTLAPGPATVASSSLGSFPNGIAFDGISIWTANAGGSVSVIEPGPPYAVTTLTTGFSHPAGILYDGTSIWVTDIGVGKLFKVGIFGIIQTVTVGASPGNPVFDGTNIWVPNIGGNSITVVQASTGNVVATITADSANKLSGPTAASFDGERILITNQNGDSVSVFKAADLSFIANVQTGSSTLPHGAGSDGINFWVTLAGTGGLLRF